MIPLNKTNMYSWSKEMYIYLSLLLLHEVFDQSMEWSKKESTAIDSYREEIKLKLNKKQVDFVNQRFLKIKNSYNETLLYSLEKMYWHELNTPYGRIIPQVEYDEKVYNIWTTAVKQRHSVVMTYESISSGISERIVNPYKTDSPYGEGYCHLKKEVRKFRFDRIIEINLTNRKFKKPKTW